jgi:hypothetical protein
MSDAARALECKQRGGEMFAKGKLVAAIEAYSEAIVFAPGEPVSDQHDSPLCTIEGE